MNLYFVKNLLIGCFLALVCSSSLVKGQGYAWDTVKINIADAEKAFRTNNLQLLAQKFELEASKAIAIQAGLFDNPTFYYEWDINHNGNPAFKDINHENYWRLQQLFRLGGQRIKRLNIQKINVRMNRYEYYDMIRSLLYQLRVNFYSIHFSLQSLKNYDVQIQRLGNLADTLNVQIGQMNAVKEVARIKAVLFALETERLKVVADIIACESNLRVLLNGSAKSFYLPQLEASGIENRKVKQLALQTLINTADTCRYDFKEYSANMDLQKANFVYQKALGLPDFNVGTTYDNGGGFAPYYRGLSIAFPVPLWNHNQGSIEAAKKEMEKSKTEWEEKKSSIENEVIVAYINALETERVYENMDAGFSGSFEKVVVDMIQSYKSKNIGLVELLDYYESYSANLFQTLQLKKNKVISVEELNFAVGKDVVK